MYWSGDLAYRDPEGFVYHAGRTADWLRIDGENLAAAPVERILVRHPSIAQAACTVGRLRTGECRRSGHRSGPAPQPRHSHVWRAPDAPPPALPSQPRIFSRRPTASS